MEKIIRTEEEIRALRDALRAELDRLPPWAYGVADALEQVEQLEAVLDGGSVVDRYANEAAYWLCSGSGTLGPDYGVMGGEVA